MNNHQFARHTTAEIAKLLHREHSHDLTFSQGNAIIATIEGELDKLSAADNPLAGPAGQQGLGFSEPRTPLGPMIETKRTPRPLGGRSTAAREPAEASRSMGDQGRLNLILAGFENRNAEVTRDTFVRRAKRLKIAGSGSFFDACTGNGRLKTGSRVGRYKVVEIRPLIARRVREGLKGDARRLGRIFRVSPSLARESVDGR